MKIKALTISQPWADLIRSGQKFVENRRWATSYRGKLAIHAGKGTQYLTKEELAKYPTGAVVAIAELVACPSLLQLRSVPPETEIEDTRFTVGDIVSHKYAEGPFCWVLDDIREIEPLSVPGKQGLWLWHVEPEAIKYVERSYPLSWLDIKELSKCLKEGFVRPEFNRNGYMDHAQWQAWNRLQSLGLGFISGDSDGADSFEINEAGRAAVTRKQRQ